MSVIDVHAHVTPERFKAAIRERGEWHGLRSRVGELQFPGFRMTPPERVAQMEKLGVDVQILSPNVGFFQYGNDPATTIAIARECNDEIAEMAVEYPGKFGGFASLPMQDLGAAIGEMERVMGDLRFKGVEVGDHVNGRTWDEREFDPFWEAAESLGAIVFFHQGGGTVVTPRIDRYHLSNAVGNLTDRTLTFGALVFGGVLDRFPKLRPLLAHAGGYTAFGLSRMDKVAGALEEGDEGAAERFKGFHSPLDSETPDRLSPITRPPSSYAGLFYYDCCTFSGASLRLLIDSVGIDQVVLGTDYPAPMELLNAVSWINGLDCLTADEKEAILSRNPGRMVGW
ncbi:MAG: amidohydrolase family protein [Candidatus Dormibacteraceae bacterium]